MFGWDGGGNVPPLIAMGKHLLARGHRVRMVGTETIGERARAAGIEFLPFRRAPSWTARPGHALEDEMDDFATHLLGPEMGEELLEAVNTCGPGVVVIDCMAGGALSAAEHLALPTAVLVHLRARFHYDAAGGSSVASLAAKEALNRQRARMGLPPLDVQRSLWAQLWPRAGKVFIASLPELEAPGNPLPDGFTYVGGVLDPDPDPLPPEVEDLVSRDGPPLAVISLSTTYMHQEHQLATAAASLGGLRGVITLGSGITADDLGGYGNTAVTRWAAHERLLPHADVVVTHAGHGTVIAALTAGVPLVCLPMGRDQHGNAEQVTRLGAGVCIDASANPAELRAAIDTVLHDGTYRAKARELAASARRLGGGSRLAEQIDSLATTPLTTQHAATTRKGH